MSGASASGLPDLEFDDTVPDARDQSGDRGVQRTTSLLVSGVDMDKPSDCQPDLDVLAKREGVLREMEDKKNQIREAKGDKIIIVKVLIKLKLQRFIHQYL